jgi:hypothetical protein
MSTWILRHALESGPARWSALATFNPVARIRRGSGRKYAFRRAAPATLAQVRSTGEVNSDCLLARAARWRGDAASAKRQGEGFDATGAIGTGAYWLGRADALRDAARELTKLTS